MKLYTRITAEDLKGVGLPVNETMENYLLEFDKRAANTETKVEIVVGDKVIKLVQLQSDKFPNLDLQLSDWENELSNMVNFEQQVSSKFDMIALSTEEEDMQQTYDVLDGIVNGRIYFKKNLSQSITVVSQLKDRVSFTISYNAKEQVITINQLQTDSVHSDYKFSHIGFGCFPILEDKQ